ncbi:hypothetical protein [Bradyrhizobium sp.]|jgi:hypothetical protein|uniref:hypothetical protein n=1 Tax=Bradyrhizobium sp. TaxID=376 RepID=UPI0025C72D1A|nr:hypothetical protein [Bradyrhizobium sp.]
MRHIFWRVATAGGWQQARRRWRHLRDRHGNASNPYSPVLSMGLLLIIAVFAFAAVPA